MPNTNTPVDIRKLAEQFLDERNHGFMRISGHDLARAILSPTTPSEAVEGEREAFIQWDDNLSDKEERIASREEAFYAGAEWQAARAALPPVEERIRAELKAVLVGTQSAHYYHVADVALDVIRPYLRAYPEELGEQEAVEIMAKAIAGELFNNEVVNSDCRAAYRALQAHARIVKRK